MEDLIDSILEKLKETGVQYITVWNNQLQRELDGEQVAVDYPAIFLELDLFNFIRYGEQYDGCDVKAKIHIISNYYSNDSQYIERNMEVLGIRDKVNKALTQFKPNDGEYMKKTDEQHDYNHTNLFHYEMTYIFHWIDKSAVDPVITINPPFNIEIIKG